MANRRSESDAEASWVDVAVIGGGLTGLATAVALLRVDPSLKIQVFERRPEPGGEYGGACRLEPNGLKAAEAISRQLAQQIRANGMSAQQMMFHDMEAGTVITRLSPSTAASFHAPTSSSTSSNSASKRTARQHAPLMIGWAELEAILEQQLPEGVIQWGSNLVGYSDLGSYVELRLQPSGAPTHPPGDTLSDTWGDRTNTGWQGYMTEPEPWARGDAADINDDATDVPPPLPSDQQTTTAPAAYEIEPSMDLDMVKGKSLDLGLTEGDTKGPSQNGGAAGSRDSNSKSSDDGGGDDNGKSSAAGGPKSAAGGSKPAARPVQPGHSEPAAAAAAAPVQAGPAAAAAAAPVQLVHAGLVLAADGAFSTSRKECIGGEAPSFDGTLRWVGRLPGNLMSTTPTEYEAWWLAPGKAFTSHPLRNGDVAWEALASTDMLATLGWQYNPDSGLLERTANPGSTSTAPGASSSRPKAVAAAPEGVEEGGRSATATATAGPGAGGGSKGEVAAAGGNKVASAFQLVAQQLEGAAKGEDKAGMVDVLEALLSNFPAPVRNMVTHTPPEVMLHSAVYIRAARSMPPCLGKGRVALLGEAARPLRPSGQEASQALEDAAELGACIMKHGVSIEALRGFELKRRRRWLHVTQVALALAACSNLGGLALHQGVVDYSTELYYHSFTPLRAIRKDKVPLGIGVRVLRGVGAALAAYGGAAAAQGLLKAAGVKGKGKKGQSSKLAAAADAAGEVLDVVLQAPAQGLQVAGKVAQKTGAAAQAAERKVAAAVAGAVAADNSSEVVYGAVEKEGLGVGTKVRRWAVNEALGASKPVVNIVSETMGERLAKKLGFF